jgi:hypothetical protein
LLSKDQVGFWKSWKEINQVKVPPVPRIDGCCNDTDIVNAFSDSFKKIYCNKHEDRHQALKNEFMSEFIDYYGKHIDDLVSPHYLSWSKIITLAGKIKIGKYYAGSIRPEHILYGSPKLMVYIHILFNSFIQHGYVATDFLKGTISPIIKDREGDASSSSSRGIPLSMISAQLFESALHLKFCHHLESDCLQFRFKSGHSTSHAAYTLKSCVDYFVERKLSVYVAFLDFSKTFDSISHHGLFHELLRRNIPLSFLLLIMYWYSNMYNH